MSIDYILFQETRDLKKNRQEKDKVTLPKKTFCNHCLNPLHEKILFLKTFCFLITLKNFILYNYVHQKRKRYHSMLIYNYDLVIEFKYQIIYYNTFTILIFNNIDCTVGLVV